MLKDNTKCSCVQNCDQHGVGDEEMSVSATRGAAMSVWTAESDLKNTSGNSVDESESWVSSAEPKNQVRHRRTSQMSSGTSFLPQLPAGIRHFDQKSDQKNLVSCELE